MKTLTTAVFVGLLLLAVSCKKEGRLITTSSVTDESSTQVLLTDNSERSSKAVRIGSQIWSRENLSVRYYRNGDKIPQEKDPVKWAKLKTGAWCWYNNDSATGHIYGRLYNWYAVTDPRGLAPEGWHVPSDAEWSKLTTFLGNKAGGKMKSTGIIEDGSGLWHAPNTHATNRSGFTGLPGGSRCYCEGGIFFNIGYYGYWWTSSESDADLAWFCTLDYNSDGSGVYTNLKTTGCSVRCVVNDSNF